MLIENLKRFALARLMARKADHFWYKLKLIVLQSTVPFLNDFAVKMEWPWASVFEARSRMYRRQVKQQMFHGVEDFQSFKKLCRDAISCVEHALLVNPEFVYGARILATVHGLIGQIEESDYWKEKLYDLRQDLIHKKKLDGLGVRFVDPFPIMTTIGVTAVYDAYIKIALLGRCQPMKLVMLVEPKNYKNFVNLHLLSYWRQYIHVIDDPDMVKALQPVSEILTTNEYENIEIDGKALATHSAYSLAQSYWDEESRPPLFILTDQDRERGEAELEGLGMPRGSWFACLHVREGGARHDEPFRQSDIAKYAKAIQSVTDRGGWVVRMGDKSMTRLPQMDKVIDYPHTALKSDFMDVFLCGACKFFIGTSSGLFTVASMFGRPIAQTNYLPTKAICLSQHDFFLPKLLKRKDNGNFISFPELFSAPVNRGGIDYYFKHVLELEPIDNTPEELEALVVELMDSLEGKQAYTPSEEGLQSGFKSMTANVEAIPGLPGIPLNPRIGQYFLNEHQHLMTGPGASTAEIED